MARNVIRKSGRLAFEHSRGAIPEDRRGGLELKNRLTVAFMVMSLLVVGATFGLSASAGPEDVCSGSKVDFENLPATVDGVTISVVDDETVHFDIPDGSTVEVCVKAGSAKQGNGPEYTTLTSDADVVHASGKELSHVSVVIGGGPTPESTEPPVVE